MGHVRPLARELCTRVAAEYQELVTLTVAPAARSFSALLELFGLSCFSPDELAKPRPTLHVAAREWLSKTLADPNMEYWHSTWPVRRRASLQTRRFLVRKHDITPPWFGSIGKPAEIPQRPRFWKLRTMPKDYLWRFHDDSSPAVAQKVLLARAVLTPFEARIDYECTLAERTLRDSLKPFGRDGTSAFHCAIDSAYTHVIYGRYDGKQSVEHYRQCEGRRLQLIKEDFT